MALPKASLVEVFAHPERLPRLSEIDWSEIVAQGHAASLLARLSGVIEEQGLAASVPVAAMRHLRSARIVAERQFQQALYEIGNIVEALQPVGCPIVLLKGAAYMALGIPHLSGRFISDLDILVPRADLGAVESALMMAGWLDAERDDYNQRYYRQWMHEVPPKRHMARGTILDVHHTVLPLTAKPKIAVDRLFAASVRIAGAPCLRVLSPQDMVLHSVTHLFHEGEFNRGLRDLIDLRGLLHFFGDSDSGFWPRLLARAAELGLEPPLFFGLRYVQILLAERFPGEAEKWLARYTPALPRRWWMDQIFLRVLLPDHPSCSDRWTGLARGFCYLRGHRLRMPAYLLLPHLIRKWIKRLSNSGAGDGI